MAAIDLWFHIVPVSCRVRNASVYKILIFASCLGVLFRVKRSVINVRVASVFSGRWRQRLK